MGRSMVALIFLFAVSAAGAQNLGPRAVPYLWESVEGAGGYLVEVQDESHAVVESERTAAGVTSTTLTLTPGSYQIRVTPLDVAKKPLTPGAWVPFPVEPVKPPVLVSMEPVSLIAGLEGLIPLSLQGLADDAEASLRSPSGTAFPVEISRTEGTALKVPPLEETGNYALVITNPPDQTLTVKGKVVVHYPQPMVSEVEPDTLEPTGQDQTLTLSGENFSSEAIVGVRAGDGGKLILLDVTSRSPTSLQAVVPKSLAAGDYRLILANGLRERQVLAGTLKIKAPPAAASEKKEQKPSRKAELQAQIEVLQEKIRKADAQNAARRTVGWVSLGLGMAGTATGAVLYSRANPVPFGQDGQVGTDGAIALSALILGFGGLVAGSAILASDEAAPWRVQIAALESQLRALDNP